MKFYSGFSNDMGDLKVPYNELFWTNFIVSAVTEFYKNNIKALEDIFKVPISNQFKNSN